MVDRENVIIGLTAHRNGNCNERGCPWYYDDSDLCLVNLLDATLELLKEQEPTRPVYNGRYWECEECQHKYNDILTVKEYAFCPWCGRRIEWEREA